MGEFPDVQSESIAVSTTSIPVIAIDRNRQIFVVQNRSGTVGTDLITLGFGVPAVAGSGVVLDVGQFYGESDDPKFVCYKGTINAVCATANGVLAVYSR